MNVNDYVFIVIDAALWLAIIWHGVNARVVGELWWSCVGIAAIISLKIGVIADPINQLAGNIYLGELLGHLLGVVIAALTMSWLVMIRHGSRQPYRRLRHSVTAAVLVTLLVTWFLGPIYAIPLSADYIPDEVRHAPILVAHWLVLELFLIAFSLLFVTMVIQEATALPPGYVRTSVQLLSAAGSVLIITMVVGLVSRVAGLTGTTLHAADITQNVLLFIVFALFFLAVAIPLTRYRRPGTSSQSTGARVESLWTWIQDATGRGPDSTTSTLTSEQPDDRLFNRVIDIRDHIWYLQRFVTPADLAAAGRSARARGLLFGTRARAHVAATCLSLAAARRAESAEPVTPPPANLSRLGGGRTLAQEAHWLAAVSDALTARQDRPAPATS